MTENDALEIKVAEALRAAMPNLTSPEAWPWLTLARAAIEAIDRQRTAPSPSRAALPLGNNDAGHGIETAKSGLNGQDV